MLSAYGTEVIVIALLINILTGLLKLPIKAYGKKKGADVGKYISLIPVVSGFGGAFAYKYLTAGADAVRLDEVFALAVSCASLSLALFAVFEKFFPKVKDSAALQENKQIIADAGGIISRLQGLLPNKDAVIEEPVQSAKSPDTVSATDQTAAVAAEREASPETAQASVITEAGTASATMKTKIILGRKGDEN
jgi:hypothetical protein